MAINKQKGLPQISKGIPRISPSSLMQNKITPTPTDEKKAQAFIKGKEPIKQYPLRMPMKLWKELSKVAFNEEKKINTIIVELIQEYIFKS